MPDFVDSKLKVNFILNIFMYRRRKIKSTKIVCRKLAIVAYCLISNISLKFISEQVQCEIQWKDIRQEGYRHLLWLLKMSIFDDEDHILSSDLPASFIFEIKKVYYLRNLPNSHFQNSWFLLSNINLCKCKSKFFLRIYYYTTFIITSARVDITKSCIPLRKPKRKI